MPSPDLIVPYVIETTPRGERGMDIWSRLLRERIIFIGTPIDDVVANSVVAQLLLLKTEDPDKEIQLFINSPGGPSMPDWPSTTPCSTSSRTLASGCGPPALGPQPALGPCC